jgi:DNA invertase Pin-like site-specific DNA recombinase
VLHVFGALAEFERALTGSAARSLKSPAPSPIYGERRIVLRALREGIDTATPTWSAVAAIMATLAELELELGQERRASSRESRRARGLPATKPMKLSPERQDQLRRLVATGEPVRALAAAFGIGRSTAYRYLSHQSSLR